MLFYIATILIVLMGCTKEDVVSAVKSVTMKEKPKAEEEIEEIVEETGFQPLPKLGANPFLTVEEDKMFVGAGYRESLDLELSAIFYSPAGSKAIIDGKICREGDVIDNKTVTEINQQKVILKDERGSEYIIRLKSVFTGSIN